MSYKHIREARMMKGLCVDCPRKRDGPWARCKVCRERDAKRARKRNKIEVSAKGINKQLFLEKSRERKIKEGLESISKRL